MATCSTELRRSPKPAQILRKDSKQSAFFSPVKVVFVHSLLNFQNAEISHQGQDLKPKKNCTIVDNNNYCLDIYFMLKTKLCLFRVILNVFFIIYHSVLKTAFKRES